MTMLMSRETVVILIIDVYSICFQPNEIEYQQYKSCLVLLPDYCCLWSRETVVILIIDVHSICFQPNKTEYQQYKRCLELLPDYYCLWSRETVVILIIDVYSICFQPNKTEYQQYKRCLELLPDYCCLWSGSSCSIFSFGFRLPWHYENMLFKYTENFATKKWKFLDKKILIFFIFVLKT